MHVCHSPFTRRQLSHRTVQILTVVCGVIIVAEEKKLPVLKHVLYPRPAGFQLCLSEARRRSAVLHDITIAYKDFEDGKRTSDLDLVKGTLHHDHGGDFAMTVIYLSRSVLGTFPSEVHLFVRRIPVSEIPQGDTEEKEVRFFAWVLPLVEQCVTYRGRVCCSGCCGASVTRRSS